VEEVGGGGWVPWSALIGSTWSDEKFNHPPILTRSNALSLPPPPPPPPPLDHLYLLFALSFSVSRAIRNVHPFSSPGFPPDESTAHLRASRCLHVSMDQDEETKLNRRLRKHPASIPP